MPSDHSSNPTSSPMRILFATRNKGKIRELRALSQGLPIIVIPAFEWPGFPEMEEVGHTFAQNATQKALDAARHTGLAALADDSGLLVNALNGEPGVRSARYSGPDANDKKNLDLLLERMQKVPWPDRKAQFRCVMAFTDPAAPTPNVVHLAEGVCKGYILESSKGKGGFGYDPVFFTPLFAKTFAELDLEIKNRISHRALAMAEMVKILQGYIPNHNAQP